MRYLVDTNVVSELRRSRPDPNVAAWAAGQDAEDLYLSVVTLGEIYRGVLGGLRRDHEQGRALLAWFDRVRSLYADRTLPITPAIAIRAGALQVPDPRPVDDAYLAATALEHDLTVVTRNVADFAVAGVRVLDPWQV